jgi:hypothetical protein
MLPGSGSRPRYNPRREPETPRGYGRREVYEGERGPRGRGKSVSLSMSLKFDRKSNLKAFYVKFSRYAEVSERTEVECRDQLCWCLDGKASEYYALLVERNHDMAYKDVIMKIENGLGLDNSPKEPRYNLVMRARLRRSSWRTGRIGSCPWLLELLENCPRKTCTNNR